jgi:hypothetical protein
MEIARAFRPERHWYSQATSVSQMNRYFNKGLFSYFINYFSLFLFFTLGNKHKLDSHH